jgi:hypothetical protein
VLERKIEREKDRERKKSKGRKIEKENRKKSAEISSIQNYDY